MIDPIVLDGDTLVFPPQFGHRTVTIVDARVIRGTGSATVDGKKVCILGDEKHVRLAATYVTPAHPVAGGGDVTIAALAADQRAEHCLNGEPLIIKGSVFTAEFTPKTPAHNPGPPVVQDATTPSQGLGSFVVSQTASLAGPA